MEESVLETKTELIRFNDIIELLPAKTRFNLSSLALLDNVANQMFQLLFSDKKHRRVSMLDNKVALMANEKEIFEILLKLFKDVKAIYSCNPVITVQDVAPGLWFDISQVPSILESHEAYIGTVVRKCNILTFLLSTLDYMPYEMGLLQDIFLDIFCPNTVYSSDLTNSSFDASCSFLKAQALLFLDFKTQVFIRSLADLRSDGEFTDAQKSYLLDIAFPPDMASDLIKRRTGGKNQIQHNSRKRNKLTASEKDFLERCERRKNALMKLDTLESICSTYDWGYYVRELLEYCNKNLGLIIWGRKGKGKKSLHAFGSHEYLQMAHTTDTKEIQKDCCDINDADVKDNESSAYIKQERVSAASTQEESNGKPVLFSIHQASDIGVENSRKTFAKTQTKLPKITKTKRAWTVNEEKILVESLKQVGPSWSKILELHGPGGKLSEGLRNRNQVQLKDKARNWKKHYLKTGKKLPYYLLKVTGTAEKGSDGKQVKGSLVKHPPEGNNLSTDSTFGDLHYLSDSKPYF